MTEHNGSFEEAMAPTIVLNGHDEAAQPEAAAEPAGAHVDAARGVFITSLGTEIELSGKRISYLMLERLIAEGKPRIPQKEVLLLGKHRQIEANPNDPGYLALLDEWNEGVKIKAMVYIFTVGVKGQPPEDFVEEQRVFFPEVNATTMKYLWVTSLLPDEDIEALAEAIKGQSLPTTKGLEEAGNFTASG